MADLRTITTIQRVIWLNADPFDSVDIPTEILERVLPAEPRPQRVPTAATAWYYYGGDSINYVGGEFTPNDSHELVIRIPKAYKVTKTFKRELNRPTAKAWIALESEQAHQIIARIVLAHYTWQAAVVKLGAGILDLYNTAYSVMDARGRGRLAYEGLRVLPLLWSDTSTLSDEDVMNRIGQGHRFGEGSAPIIPDLLRALDDPDPYVQTAAVNLLETYTDEDVSPEVIAIVNAALRRHHLDGE
jgi:hypothetical protein